MITISKNKYQATMQSIKQLRSNNKALTKQYQQLQADYQNLKSIYQHNQNIFNDLQSQIEIKDREIKKLNLQICGYELSGRTSDYKNIILQKDQEIENLKAKIKRQQENLALLNNKAYKFSEMNQTVQMYSAEIAKKNQRIHELENQYQSLQQQCSWIYINQNELQQKINECNSLKEQNMRLSDSANYYNFQLNLTKQALEKIRIENENLTNNLNRIQQQLREKTEENQKILSTNETLKVAFKDLIAKINNCKSY